MPPKKFSMPTAANIKGNALADQRKTPISGVRAALKAAEHKQTLF
jgi:hypothetical protein